ncbi:MAG: U32 family peptidase [Firmicutes bacterium]|nr:U32 family peptidase [Bacillota bacterium]
MKAAIAAGADAVYLGGKEFSARQYAANFDLAALQAATDFIHLHGKKIYVAVNTLIASSEMEKALSYLSALYNLGIDAVIVQDLGLIALCRRFLPQLDLHASTQMTVHNLEGVHFLKELGVRRVVLARELTMAEVAAIAGGAGIQVEVFVHGALCICYSGQCLMSSMIGGRSGNRGRCAQPCRLEYQLLKGRTPQTASGPHLLSPKDLALLGMIPELDRAGVCSLKVEGRMKRPEYVYQVIKVYRGALDRYFADPDQFRAEPAEFAKLEEVFNRGFTTGYFGGNRNEQLMSFARPNNRGIFLGRIAAAEFRSQKITLKLEAELGAGDGIEVWVSQGGRVAGPIRDLKRGYEPVSKAIAGETVNFSFDGKVFPGDRVFKVFSAVNHQELKQVLAPGNPAIKIPCRVEVEGEAGKPLRITYQDFRGNQGAAVSSVSLQAARNHPLTLEALREHLGRLGDTPYYLTEIQARIPANLMLPLGELNRARRQAILELTRQALAPYSRDPALQPPASLRILRVNSPGTAQEKKQVPAPVTLSVWVSDIAGVVSAAGAGATLIYAGGDELTGFHWDQSKLREAVECGRQAGARLVIGMPRINREGQRNRWKKALKEVCSADAHSVIPDGILVSDLGALWLTLRESNLPVYLNYTLNLYNIYSIEGLAAIAGSRIKQVALSPELTLKQIMEIKAYDPPPDLELLVHGPLELMISEYCPVSVIAKRGAGCKDLCKQAHYFLRDRIGLDFPVYMDQFCRMHLLNSVDHCLYQELNQFARSSGLVLRLDLRTYQAAEAGRLVQLYREALQAVAVGSGGQSHSLAGPEQVITELKEMTGRGITKGHYFRGVE